MTTTTTLPNGTWAIDTAATELTVTVKKMKLITVPATLAVTSGTIEIADGAVSRVEIVADAASYTSSQGKRDEHVASPDFLDVAAHPTITFSAESVASTSQVAGTVEIKGRKSPITFAVSDLNISESSASFSATSTVDRTAIGVDKLPTFVIARDLDIAVTATATPQS